VDLSLRLMPFQAEGVDFLVDNQRALLAWEMGTGKTPTAVRACAKVRAERILVFCPLIATYVWCRHFRDWSGYFDIRVLDAENAVAPFTFIEGKGVRIIPYSRAHKSAVIEAAARFSDQWDVVVIDEAHYLKNPAAKRTRAIYGPRLDLDASPLEHAARIWCLTGTPLLNGPHELWTHLKALKPEMIRFGNLGVLGYEAFMDRYCHTKLTTYGRHVTGAKNTNELAQRLKPFTSRKRIKDVILDLPPLRVTTYELPENMIVVTPELDEALADLRIEGIDGFDDDDLLAAAQSGAVAFSTARRLVGMAKVPGVVAMVDDMIQGGAEKIIVFAHHRDVVHDLAYHLEYHRPLVIQGGTPQATRDQAIDIFQNDPRYPLIILSIEAASEAITLSAASQVIIAEPSPVPSKNAQAIARAHRKGQRNPVLAQFVTLPGTFDAHFMRLIARKTRDIMKVVDPDLVPRPEQPSFPGFPEEIPV
jgi:SWI/SNF-related matrix-associated actin-dependent regulator of chromatin subfamily A-like protein 1